MASRGGPRASGSDGSDFTHREQVATRYQASTLLKSKLKVCAYVSLFLCLPLAAFILASHLGYFRLLLLVEPRPCHYLLLLTCVFSLLYIMALPRNRKSLLQLGNLGTLVCGLGGAAYGFYMYFSDIRYLITEGDVQVILRPPVFVAATWYTLFTVKVILYVQTLHYARQLMVTWDAKKTK